MNDEKRFETCLTCFKQGHSTNECTVDKADLQLIGSIAAFIGARLQHPLPRCNSTKRGGKPISTIKVEQYKEKFWFVRIYATLADADLVEDRWYADGNPTPDAGAGTVPPEFKALCFKRDAFFYRRCYTDMIALVPRLKERIRSQADYAELLHDDEADMERRIDELAAPHPEMPSIDQLAYYRTKYEVETTDQLKAVLRSFYGTPKLQDMIW